MKGHHIVMVLDVNLVRPTQPHVSHFWGKTAGLCPTYSLLLWSKVFLHPGCVLFPWLHLLFNHESDHWNDQHYEAFVQSVKPNFPGDSWGYLRYVANFKHWITMLMVDIKSPEELEKHGFLMGKCQGRQCNLTCNNTIDILSYSAAAPRQLPTPTEMCSTQLERLKEGQWISGDIVTFALQCVSLTSQQATYQLISWYTDTPSTT